MTEHTVYLKDCLLMNFDIPEDSVHLVVTSPPYYNAPFDYAGLYENYEGYLDDMREMFKCVKRALAPGRIACFVIDDMLVKGVRYPILADFTKMGIEEGFKYRDRITWRKPDGYVRISRRSGSVIKHPWPMYFYPDNVQESILIFQNGKYSYKDHRAEYKAMHSADDYARSSVRISELTKEKWYMSVWDITNVLPKKDRLEKGVAAFPEEIPSRLIKLFSYVGETVLDPFLGSGTTALVARKLARNSIGYEINSDLDTIIDAKVRMKGSVVIDETGKFELRFMRR